MSRYDEKVEPIGPPISHHKFNIVNEDGTSTCSKCGLVQIYSDHNGNRVFAYRDLDGKSRKKNEWCKG